ncbi:MAG: hypothetical protein P9L94_15945, partial [Candidatus Hinthialibacter antarcticus]|nr:hypothetical protein [Candidatus Hinthialibacter antarcticus]
MNQSLLRWLRPSVLYPTLLALILSAFYGGYLAPHNQMFTVLTWDAFRDIITAQHIRAGGAVWADPVLDGYWFWYPPTNAILFSTISSLL